MNTMRKYTIKKYLTVAVSAIAVAFIAGSCLKDSDGSPDIKAGTPVFKSITPGEAPGGSVLTLQGSGLGNMRSIVFDLHNVPTTITSTLNTEETVIFHVPDTAYGGPQNIILTNSIGRTLVVPFSVIALPTVTTAFPMDFQNKSRITLTGSNLNDVTSVILEGSGEAASIISQIRKSMVIEMPASTSNRTHLVLVNSSGSDTTSQEFVNVTQALAIFKDDYIDPAQNWSWGGTYTPSADDSISGSKSLKAAYDASGSWGGLQIGMGSELSLPAGTKYFTYWAKGADVDKQVTVQIKGNNWSTDNSKVITVPAGKWTYFREEASTFIPGVNSVSVIVFQIHDAGKTIYFDNILFVK